MLQQHDFSAALASYREYLRLDHSQRKLSDFITIIDSLFPPISTPADDLLFIGILMADPANFFAQARVRAGDNNGSHWNVLLTDDKLRRVALALSPQSLGVNSPTLVAPLSTMNAAGGTSNVYKAEQLEESPDLERKPLVSPLSRTDSYNSFDYDAGRGPCFPPSQYRPPSYHPVSDLQTHTGRPYPRMRPPPPPSPTVPVSPKDVASGKRVHVQPPLLPQAIDPVVRVPVGSVGPFIGHGMTNRLHFKPSGGTPSGLRIKRSPSLALNFSNTPLRHRAYPKVEVPEGMAGSTAVTSVFTHSGRHSSPINLCSSSDQGDEDTAINPGDTDTYADAADIYDDADVDADNTATYSGIDDSKDDELPEEVEGLEEAHHRAASSTACSRSSSPIDPRDIIIKGGQPILDEAELDELLSFNRHSKLWLMVEKGLAIEYIFGLGAPADRYLKALTLMNPKRPARIWKELQSDIFRNSRKASAIAVAVSKVLLVYKDIKYMLDVSGFTYDLKTGEDDALRAIKVAIDEARDSGAPLSSIITPWEYYIWTRDPEDGWYALINAKLGDHPNFQVTGQHRSGRVTPSPGATPMAAAKAKERRQEKRAREDDEDDHSTLDLTGSPRPKAAVRQRPSTDLGDGNNLPLPSLRSSTPIPRMVSGSGARASLSTAHARAAASAAGHPMRQAVTQASPSASAHADIGATSTAAASTRTPTLSVAELQAQLLEVRKAQLELDQENVNARNQLISEEHKALEEDRARRLELDSEQAQRDVVRAEREAAELEEKINFGRRSQYFDQCLRVASSTNLPPDLIQMASDQVRQALESGMNFYAAPFLSPRPPMVQTARRATSVPISMQATPPGLPFTLSEHPQPLDSMSCPLAPTVPESNTGPGSVSMHPTSSPSCLNLCKLVEPKHATGNAQPPSAPNIVAPSRLHLVSSSAAPAASPSRPAPNFVPCPPGLTQRSLVNQLGLQLHATSPSVPPTPQLHINKHTIPEAGETTPSPGGEGFVHIDGMLYRHPDSMMDN
ncbi:SH3 domain-containing protein [Ceratobasidium theobromae]|uniref:SH3 domain-containing protein n=1 Tax=Ceratobasidium theobromae TaxID=1582974 RepID=A0A5N5QIL2_9AGAM|nr:SH3 domain-containing protein [Ceratobasidium theobromae]